MRARIFTKRNLVVLYNLTYLSFKFHKDRSVRCGDICKTILTIIKPIRREQVVSPSVANVILDMPKLTGSCLSDTGIG